MKKLMKANATIKKVKNENRTTIDSGKLTKLKPKKLIPLEFALAW